MTMPILATKLYTPRPRPGVVSRPRLTERLNAGLHRKLTLISAPAGFGKTTLISDWLDTCQRPVAWLSLDAGDSDPTRFLMYLVATVQTLAPTVGEGVVAALLSPQPPPPEAILTALINELAIIPDDFICVLDDYHATDSAAVDDALAFLLEHLPPQMHLVIATREDPRLPLARLRARGHLTELRANDLRFTHAEAAGFLNQTMGLDLGADDIAALETRTEGWIVGLQLAAISVQGHHDATGFIQSFTGSHHFVLDYLLEEVLHQQPESVQRFLLHTSILDRLCGPLCDAVLDEADSQAALQYLEQANLFIIPLDNERRWYRYHHLFADLLRQRLQQSGADVAALHQRASTWFEDNGLDLEAFQHAVAADDIESASRLLEGDWMPLLYRGAVTPVLHWLQSLPEAELDARPSLWVMYACAILFMTQTVGIEERLQAAERAMQRMEPDAMQRDLVGRIAAIRATVAVTQHDQATIIEQAQLALDNLHPANLPNRTAANWTLGCACQLQGDRAMAGRAYAEAIAISEEIGHFIIHLMATIGLGNIQELENQLYLAAQTYERAVQLSGDPPQLVACEPHLGLAHIHYEWNDLDAAHHHAENSARLARQIPDTDRYVAADVCMARLKLAQGDVAAAHAILSRAAQAAEQHGFVLQVPAVAAMQVLVALRQRDLETAAQLAQQHNLPLSQARVHLAGDDPAAALTVLQPYLQAVRAREWGDEQLRALVLQALAFQAQDEMEAALGALGEALTLAAPGGFVRTFIDEGVQMAQLLVEAQERGLRPDYVGKLLAAFEDEYTEQKPYLRPAQPLIEPLSERELEVLQLIALGLSNREISERLVLALDTVKGHNRRIYGKLLVQRRTEAVARARELGLL